MQTKLERLNLYYWRKKDIAVVLNVQHKIASRLFDAAMIQMKIDNDFIVDENKVEQRLVFKIANINERLLRKQIESEETQKRVPPSKSRELVRCTAFVVHPHYTNFKEERQCLNLTKKYHKNHQQKKIQLSTMKINWFRT